MLNCDLLDKLATIYEDQGWDPSGAKLGGDGECIGYFGFRANKFQNCRNLG